jgi:hypothetical protein
MKKIIIVLLFIFCIRINTSSIYAGEYETYQEIEFEHSGARFLEDYTSAMFKKYYKKIKKRKFWGWRTYMAYETEKVYFTKETLYVIENQGETAITETFSFKSVETTKKQYDVAGDIKMEGSGEALTFKLGLEEALSWDITTVETTNYTEDFEIKVHVDPMTELRVTVEGEGKVSNGVGKYYRFFRNVRKGGWEVFLVTTEYYAIRKVKLDES